MKAFIFAAVLAASIGALTGYSFADMLQVYQSKNDIRASRVRRISQNQR